MAKSVQNDVKTEKSESSHQVFKIIQGGLGRPSTPVTFDGLKEYLQPKLSADININFLIGSGSSKPAIDLMSTTFDNYKIENKSNDEITELIQRYEKECGEDNKNDIEKFLSWLGSRILGLSKDELKNEKEVQKNLIDALVSSITQGFNSAVDKNSERLKEENRKSQNPQRDASDVVQNYEQFIRRVAKLRERSNSQVDTVNLFTTNYDLFIEYALDQLDYLYTDGFRPKLRPEFNIAEFNHRPVDIAHRFKDRWSVVKPFFRVYKLHGSINWEKDNAHILKTTNWNTKTSSGKKLPEVIAPTSSKYADSQGAPYSDLFRELSVQLLNPNSLLIINGFGFGDEHINELLKQALSRSDFEMIAFVNDQEDNTQKFMNYVGSNAKATFVTNNDGNQYGHYFSTLVDLLAFKDPFELPDDEDSEGDKDDK
ncbi:SIR2 family protein [Pediococcus inopinatus]|uniref:SIR2 family protein n=1 Tax=Pediococcus inopinatus TaxID=114090 RepID=UPI000708B4CB|nr:SIR2 family protein [Pediococcus inopinatus]AVK99527.1 SIR2 family protein [Pediococcus inopinatus]